jgi:hypothetical protein
VLTRAEAQVDGLVFPNAKLVKVHSIDKRIYYVAQTKLISCGIVPCEYSLRFGK